MKSFCLLLIVIFSMFLTGCATYVQHNIPEAKCQFKEIEADKKSDVTYSVSMYAPKYFLRKEYYQEIDNTLKQKLEECGYFNQVTKSDDLSNFHINFDVRLIPCDELDNFASGYFTLMCMGIIPMWIFDGIECDATVYEFGLKSETFYAKEEVKTVRWLPMIFVGIFKNSEEAKKEIANNYFHFLINQMEEKKLLPVRQSPPHKDGTKTINKDEIVSVRDEDYTSSGSGFCISADGYILTNHHVVEGAKRLRVIYDKKSYPAYIVARDKLTDIALLKAEGEFDFIDVASNPAALGEKVFTTGFPNPDIQGFNIKYTNGNISSTSGIQDDSRVYQISVPIQPGNSGGPLVNNDGQVVGMIVSGLSDLLAYEISGSLPQNVNYAIKNTYINAFLLGVPELKLRKNVTDQTAISKAQAASVLILNY